MKTVPDSQASRNEAVRHRALYVQQDRIISDMLTFIVARAGEQGGPTLFSRDIEDEEPSERDNLVVSYYQNAG